MVVVSGALKTFQATVASLTSGNTIEAHLDTVDGRLLGKVTTTATANLLSYAVVSGAMDTTGITGRHAVFFVIKGSSDIGSISFVELK